MLLTPTTSFISENNADDIEETGSTCTSENGSSFTCTSPDKVTQSSPGTENNMQTLIFKTQILF
jgi:hypothetical protein